MNLHSKLDTLIPFAAYCARFEKAIALIAKISQDLLKNFDFS